MDKKLQLVGGTPGPATIVRKRGTYFISVLSSTGKIKAIKLGVATWPNGIERRLKTLQTGSHEPLKLLLFIEGNHERKLHREWAGYRVRGEFFAPAPRLLQLLENLREVSRLVAEVESQGHPRTPSGSSRVCK